MHAQKSGMNRCHKHRKITKKIQINIYEYPQKIQINRRFENK